MFLMMKLWLIVIIVILACCKQALEVTRDQLKAECPEDSTVSRLIRASRNLIGFPPPKPPWWKSVLCDWVKRNDRQQQQQQQDSVQWLISLLLTVRLVLGPITYRKRHRKTAARKSATRRAVCKGQTKPKRPIQPPAIQFPTAAIRTPPIESPANDTRKLALVIQTRASMDGHIYIPHNKSQERQAYERVLLGPVSRCFEVIRLMLAARLKDLGIPDTAIRWTTKADPSGTPEFLGVSTKDMRVAVVFVPGDGVNIQTQRLGPARGLIREVTYQTFRVTYRGFIPGEKSTTLLYGSG